MIKLIFCLLFFIPSLLFAHEWLSDYKNDHGVSCCGEQDCILAEVVLLSFVPPNIYTFRVNGTQITLNTTAAFPSEDGQGRWCHSGWIYLYDAWDTHETDCSKGMIDQKCYNCIFFQVGS